MDFIEIPMPEFEVGDSCWDLKGKDGGGDFSTGYRMATASGSSGCY